MANMQVSSTFKESDLVFYSSEEDMDIGAQYTIWSSPNESAVGEDEVLCPSLVQGSPHFGDNGEQTDTALEDTSQDTNSSLECRSDLWSTDDDSSDADDADDDDDDDDDDHSNSYDDDIESSEETDDENPRVVVDFLENPEAFMEYVYDHLDGQTEVEIATHMRIGGIDREVIIDCDNLDELEFIANYGSLINEE